jgi:ABC-2 type transport system permease protein
MILTLTRKELRSLFAAHSTWWLLAVLQFLFAWFFFARMDDYLQIQAQLAQTDSAPGVTIAVAAPLCSALALMLMMLIPLFTMRLIAEERRNRTWILLITAPVSSAHIVLGKFCGLLALLTFIIAGCGVMLLTLALGTRADFGLILSNIGGVWFLAASYAALGLYLSSLTRQPIVAAVSAIALCFGMWLLDLSASDSPLLRALSPTSHFQNLNVGLINSADIVYFVLFIGCFLWLTVSRLENERRYASS